jgi:FtsP/CotA-like multicopper oxidase with cupredoxin domain
MDGVAGVTQRAIPAHTSQLYDFVCPLGGVFWYHSHFKDQYIDGETV